jgi:hypothetical protein
MKAFKRSNLSGFTLIEAAAGSFVLLLVLTVSINYFNSYSNLNETCRNSTIITSHLQYVLEEIRKTPYNDRAALISAGNWDLTTAQINAKGLTALVQESIDTGSSGPSDSLTVTVTAIWKDRANRQRTAGLQTFLVGYD